MVARISVLTYFALFLISVGVADLSGVVLMRGMPLVPAALYIVIHLGTQLVGGRRRGSGSSLFEWYSLGVLLYVTLYSVLYFPRAFSGATIVGTLPTLIVHFLFWHLVYDAPVYRSNRPRFFRDLWSSVVIGFGTGFAIAFYAAGWEFRPGAIHNLSWSPLVRSDLDVPMLVISVALIGYVTAFLRRRVGKDPLIPANGRSGYLSGRTGLLLFGLALFAMYMYSRRTPMIAAFGAMALLSLPERFNRRIVYAAVLFPLVPLVWEAIAGVLVLLTQNPVVDAVLERNDVKTYLTATNRLGVWLRAIDFISNVRLQHLWGYGGVPAVVIVGRTWQHAHNGFLQLFFDAGVVTLTLAVTMILWAYMRLSRMIEWKYNMGQVLILFGVLTEWLVIAAVEPALRGYSVVHMMPIMLMAVVGNLYGDCRRERMAEKQPALEPV